MRPQRAPLVSGPEALLYAFREHLETAKRVRLPSPRFREDPVAFFRDILGVKPWSKQVEVIEAVRDHQRVAVSSGHKVSKSHTAAGIALWFYSSFDDARVVMSSTTSRQVDQILWRELKMMLARGARCVACKEEDPDERRISRPCPHSALITGKLGERAHTGLRSVDFREVKGFTAREPEAVAGVSGRNLLYILDEASGIPDEIFEAIEGNRAGGARVVMFSNPTRTSGAFFDAFHSKSKFYKTITISSESTPNVVEGRVVIPGLATREWVDEKREEWGEDSALYKVRVKGEFATKEDGKIFSIHAISEAERRWKADCDACDGEGTIGRRACTECGGTGQKPAAGRLFIGLDPAGASGSGDETAFAMRRGMKVLSLVTMRGLNEEGHLVHALSLASKHKLPREKPVVVIGRDGNIGAAVYGLMRNAAEHPRATFELVGVRESDRAVRQPQIYDRMRDELTANFESWIRDGGAIPEDTKLAPEMHILEWKQQVNGRLKVTPKDVIKKALGRSPDRYDAVALSCWEPLSLLEDAPESAKRSARQERDDDRVPDIDPYGGGIDPYGGRD